MSPDSTWARRRTMGVAIAVAVAATLLASFGVDGPEGPMRGPGLVPDPPSLIYASLAPDTRITARPAAGSGVGFRTDGTGLYPQARPPVEWSDQKNVVWATPLPSWSNAIPVLVEGKIFVCAEPDTLVCLRASDGEVLWQHAAEVEEGQTPEQKAKAAEVRARNAAVRKELDAAEYEMRRVVNASIRKPDDAALKARASEATQKATTVRARLEPEPTSAKPGTHESNGYSSATPVSDGQRVAVSYGTGAAACYDLDGRPKWAKRLDRPTDPQGCSASPLLVGDTLLVFIKDLVALNADTGEELWRTAARPGYGSPLAATLGDTPCVLTPGGQVVRVGDGKVLAADLAPLTYNTPVLGLDAAYYVQDQAAAYELPDRAAEGMRLKRLWQAKLKSDRYYASPVLHDGRLYAITQAGILSVIDAHTGKLVGEKKLDLGGTVFPSPALAGPYLYVSSDAGTTAVLEPGPELKEVARNKLESFRSSPVFEGDRMYVRGLKKLYCIAAAG